VTALFVAVVTTLNLVLPVCRYNDGEAVGGVRAVFRRQVCGGACRGVHCCQSTETA